jgi:hypothetical protein
MLPGSPILQTGVKGIDDDDDDDDELARRYNSRLYKRVYFMSPNNTDVKL